MKIGWIGAGIMGQPMVCHLLHAGHEVHVYARHPEKVQLVLNHGAILDYSIKELVRSVDVVCTMVGFPSDVESVYEDIFKYVREGQVLIDFTTSSPSLAKDLYTKGKALLVDVLDAPVTGGDVGAKNGKLTILVGGERRVFDQCMDVFTCFGSQIEYCGLAGCGQHVKMANQIMIANTLQGICEAMMYLSHQSMDESLVYRFLKNGAAGSKQLELQGQKMLDEDYAPGFYVKHFVKDLKIALQECDVNLKGVDIVVKEYLDLMDRGMSDLGTQCLIEYFRRPKIKAVIFDMDGLMFDTEIMFKDAFREKAQQMGVSCPDDFCERLIGCDSRQVKYYEEQYPGVTDVMTMLQQERVDYFFKYFKEPGSANKPGLKELMEYLDEKEIPYVIASSSAKADILKFMSHAGFEMHPKDVISGKEGFASKPSPEIFLEAAKRLGVKPNNCLVLEDSKHGIMAASNAHMHSIFVPDQIIPDDEMKAYIDQTKENLFGVISYLDNLD